MTETWFIDFHASKSRVHVSKNVCPCLTRTRAGMKGYWVTSRGSLLTTQQMLALQGIKPGRLVMPLGKCTHRQIDSAIGNAVCVPVLQAILTRACQSLGYLA